MYNVRITSSPPPKKKNPRQSVHFWELDNSFIWLLWLWWLSLLLSPHFYTVTPTHKFMRPPNCYCRLQVIKEIRVWGSLQWQYSCQNSSSTYPLEICGRTDGRKGPAPPLQALFSCTLRKARINTTGESKGVRSMIPLLGWTMATVCICHVHDISGGSGTPAILCYLWKITLTNA
jgi:hypothetical protein